VTPCLAGDGKRFDAEYYQEQLRKAQVNSRRIPEAIAPAINVRSFAEWYCAKRLSLLKRKS